MPSSWTRRDHLGRCVASSSPKRTSTWLSTTSLRTSTPRGAQRARRRTAGRGGSSARRARRRRRGRASAAPRRPRSRGRGARTRASSRLRRAARGRRPGPGSSRVTAHRGAVRLGMGAEDEPAVVRDVEPLVRVGRPRVGALDARDEVPRAAALAAAHSPNAPSTCSQAPVPARGVGDRVERVERAGVDVAGLRADDRRAVEPPASAVAQRVGQHPALVVGRDRDDRSRCRAEQPQRAIDRGRGAPRRRARGSAARRSSPSRVHVPADALEHARGAPRRARSRAPSGSR